MPADAADRQPSTGIAVPVTALYLTCIHRHLRSTPPARQSERTRCAFVGPTDPTAQHRVADREAAMGPSPATDPQEGRFPRRRFLGFLAGFSLVSTAAMVFAPILGYLVPPKASGAAAGGKVLVGTIADIPLGQGKVVPVGSRPTIVINTEQGVKAYSAICTHLGCIVAYDPTSTNIVCPCHDGRFSPSSGAVLSGPPPAPLPQAEVSVEGDEIYIVSA
jgi:cytochrome b6-f complex iron-sulfur subunit